MNLYILGKSVYYIFIMASIIFPLQAFYKYFPKKGTSQKSLLIAYGCYAVFLFAMFFVSNYVVVSVISFIILPIWVLNNILFLEGTKGFRASLTVIFYIFALLSESFTGMLVGVMSLLFPKWNLISLYIGRNGSDFTLIVTTAIDIIVFFFASRIMEKALGKYMHLINTKLILLLGLPVVIVIFIINILCVMPTAQHCMIAFMLSVPLFAIVHWKVFRHGTQLLQEQEQLHLEEKQRLVILKQENAHYQEMNEEYRKLRKWNHDIKNHLLVLSHLSEREDYKKVMEYIDTMQNEAVGENKTIPEETIKSDKIIRKVIIKDDKVEQKEMKEDEQVIHGAAIGVDKMIQKKVMTDKRLDVKRNRGEEIKQ